LGGRGSWRSTGRSLEQIDRALEVNLRAPIVLARELAKELTDNQVDKR
jgi:short-subunit dehydrogenase involved in D-alanine esterification of teichoic acids